MLVNAAAFGALFAYVSGSSLFFIGAAGLSSSQYSVVFAATSVGIMAGTFANGQVSTQGVAPDRLLLTGLVTALVSMVLAMVFWSTLAGVAYRLAKSARPVPAATVRWVTAVT